jgi:hypothetical protein
MKRYCSTHRGFKTAFIDYIFSKARQPSGHIQLQDIENLWPFVNTALRLY